MLKKLFSIFLSGVFLFSSLGTAAAEVPNTANGKLGAVETVTYGQEQTGAIVERIKKLEKDYECSNTSGGMMNRINNLYDTTFDNSSSPSLITSSTLWSGPFLTRLVQTLSRSVSAIWSCRLMARIPMPPSRSALKDWQPLPLAVPPFH